MNGLQIIKQQELLGKNFKIYGDYENPLFLAKDVAEWIEHSDVSTMLRNVDENEKATNIVCTLGGNQSALFLTEDGLYEVLMQSRKPIAKEFKKHVKVILKDIRKTGMYTNPKLLSGMDMVKLQLQALSEVGEKVNEVNARVDTLEEKIDKRITLECGQQHTLQGVISKRAYERVGLAFPNGIKENVSKYFNAIYKDLKNRFGVASYRDINVNDYTDAITYVKAWIEPAEVRAVAA